MLALMVTLNEYLWVSDFVILCIFSTIAFKRKNISSSLLTQAAVVIISGTIIQYQDLVNGFIAPTASSTALNLWLFGFAIYDSVIILSLLVFYKLLIKQYKLALRLGYIGMSALVVLNLIYSQYAPFVFGAEFEAYKLWIIVAFFFGVALFDGFAVFALYKLHSLFKLTHCLIARMYMLAFAVASIIQLAGFCAKYFWHSKDFEAIYQFSLASINISTSFVTLLIAVLAVYHFYTNKNKEGLVWRI